MKANIVRWCLAVLMLFGMALFLSSPAVAEVKPIPMDMKAHGAPDPRQGKKWDTEYEDESIQVQIFSAERKPKSSLTKITAHWAHIKIADPSQLRTTMSNESYDDATLAYPWHMAESVNAIVACNGDFMKYKYNVGYVVKQGVFYRDALDGSRDILIVDDRGDFHVVIKATSDQMAAKIQELTDDNRMVVNTFSFGPVLVPDPGYRGHGIRIPHRGAAHRDLPIGRTGIRHHRGGRRRRIGYEHAGIGHLRHRAVSGL